MTTGTVREWIWEWLEMPASGGSILKGGTVSYWEHVVARSRGLFPAFLGKPANHIGNVDESNGLASVINDGNLTDSP